MEGSKRKSKKEARDLSLGLHVCLFARVCMCESGGGWKRVKKRRAVVSPSSLSIPPSKITLRKQTVQGKCAHEKKGDCDNSVSPQPQNSGTR